jgi:nucleotide-binding universal stress UspA family protein
VVVGVDGSVASRAALTAAVEEAERLDGVVEIVTTYQVVDHWTDLGSVVVPAVEQLREEAERPVREMVEALRADRPGTAGPDISIEVLEGTAGDALTRRSREADLLVVGSRGRGAFRALLLGSVALHCAMHASCPVLVVRPGSDRATAAARSDAGRSEPAMSGS